MQIMTEVNEALAPFNDEEGLHAYSSASRSVFSSFLGCISDSCHCQPSFLAYRPAAAKCHSMLYRQRHFVLRRKQTRIKTNCCLSNIWPLSASRLAVIWNLIQTTLRLLHSKKSTIPRIAMPKLTDSKVFRMNRYATLNWQVCYTSISTASICEEVASRSHVSSPLAQPWQLPSSLGFRAGITWWWLRDYGGPTLVVKNGKGSMLVKYCGEVLGISRNVMMGNDGWPKILVGHRMS